jgi:oligosaccharide repeat unit polymerase
MYLGLLIWEVSCLWSWHQVTGRLFDAYSLFATTVWLFNGGGVALTQVLSPDPYAVFDTMRLPVLRNFTNASVVGAFHLVLFCLSAMHLGALLGTWRRQAAGPARWKLQQAGARQDSRMGWIGGVLVGISIIPAIWTIRAGVSMVQKGGYMALYQTATSSADDDAWYFMFASGLVPGALYLAGADLDNRRLRWIARILILSFSTGMLALGTRAAFYQNTVALLWFQHHGVRPIRKAAWGLLLVGGLLLATLVYWSREYAGHSLMSWASFQEAGVHAIRHVTEPLSEMGSSVLIVIFVQDLVPLERDLGWGESYYQALLSMLPGSVVGDHFRSRETEESWLCHAVSPETARAGGGLGFSFIAEAYMNFGIGAPLFLGITGFFLGRFAAWVHALGRSSRLAFAACAISILLFSARASSLSFLRRIITLCVVPYAVLYCGHVLDSLNGCFKKETVPLSSRRPSPF